MRLLDAFPARPLRDVKRVALPKPKRPPSYWLVTSDEFGLESKRQVTLAEAVFYTVVELLETGEVELPREERETVTTYFARRAHLNVTSQRVGDSFGLTRQRIEQIEHEAIGKLRRAATSYLGSAPPELRDSIIQVRRLEDFA